MIITCTRRQALKVAKTITPVRWKAVERHHRGRRWTTKTKSRFALGIQIRVSYPSYESLNPSGMRVIETAHRVQIRSSNRQSAALLKRRLLVQVQSDHFVGTTHAKKTLSARFLWSGYSAPFFCA